jgi:hypothetical protein
MVRATKKEGDVQQLFLAFGFRQREVRILSKRFQSNQKFGAGGHMAGMEPIPEDRPLTAQEAGLVRWLLEHGHPDAAGFVPQLADAWVVSRCPCGCASVDFAIGGAVPPAGTGIHVLADYVWQAAEGAQCGVFVFARGGQLAGLEVWSADGMNAVSSLPAVKQLRPLVASQSAEPGPIADRPSE